MSPARIYPWRKQAREGTLDPPSPAIPSFARVEFGDQVGPEAPGLPVHRSMEIRLADGTTSLVGSDISEDALRRALGALGR